MLIDEKIQEIQNLTKRKVTYAEIASIFNLTRSAVQNWSLRKRPLKEYEIQKIDEAYSINQVIQKDTFVSDIIQIPYWKGLPDELKHPEYPYVIAQRTSIEQDWRLNPDNLCIISMNGNALEEFWYKIRNNDILIIDKSETKVNANGCGVYFATSRNNSMFWVREMKMLYNGDIEFKSYAPSGSETKAISREELEKVDFRVIGKVIKNVSFRL